MPSLLDPREQEAAKAAEAAARDLDARMGPQEDELEEWGRKAEALYRNVLGRDFPQEMRKAWGSLCQTVYDGRAAQAHTQRDEFEAGCKLRLSLLGRVFTVLNAPPTSEVVEAEWANQILLQLGEAHKLFRKIFGAWKTQEDLEHLAAQDFPLGSRELKKIAASHPPPAAWYEQTRCPSD